MKIFLAAPFRKQPGDPHWFWIKALKSLGHQVKVYRLNYGLPFKPLKSLDLKKAINRFQPDEIFFSGGIDAVYPFPATVFFTGVAAKTLSAAEREIGIKAKLVIVNDPGHVQVWKKLGARQAVCLPISAIDPDSFKPRPVKRIFPVSFVGSLFINRQRFLLKLSEKFPQVKIWGWQPPKAGLLPGLKPFYQGEVWGRAAARVYQKSLIGLNLAPEHLPFAGNIRTFEIPAGGALLLSDRLNPDWFESGKEAVVFHGIKDCIQKANYYLKHQALLKKIAAAGRQRVFWDHTYQQRFKNLIYCYLR